MGVSEQPDDDNQSSDEPPQSRPPCLGTHSEPEQQSLVASSSNPTIGANSTTTVTKMEALEIEMGQRLDDDNIATSNYEDYEFEEEENFVAPDQQHQRTDVASILRRDIEDGTGGENDNEEHGGALLNTTLSEEEPSDMQSLLGGGEGHVDGSIKLQPQAAAAALSKDDRPRKKSCFFRCCSTTHASPDPPPPPHGLNAMGNIRIPFPDMYVRTGGWGVIGPHWFGPPCIVLLLSLASYYFVYTCSWQQHRYGTAATGAALALSTLTFLLQAAYQDPGIIRPDRFLVPDPVPRTYRWCEVCNYHQPPRAAHCPDCNVCIAGFDHHCVWMSLCVGKGNFKPFMRFNLSWMAYFLYAVIWILIALSLRHYR